MRRSGRGWWAGLGAAVLAAWLAGCGTEDVPVQELFTLRNQGLLSLQRGQLPEAQAQFARLVELAPDEPLGHANLGLTLLRAGRYDEALPHLQRARRLDPGSVEIALMLARLHVVSGRPEEARELLEEMAAPAGGDARLSFALAELDQRSTDPAGIARYEARLREVLAAAPASLPARLRLAESLLRRGEADSVRRHLEEVRRIPPDPPADAAPHLAAALERLGAGDLAGGGVELDRFHRAMEITAPYQASLAELGWVEGTLAGAPVLTFAPEEILSLAPTDSGPPAVRFVEATAEAGLPGGGADETPGGSPVVAVGDVDGDGSADLLLAGADGATLFRVQRGLVQEVTERIGTAAGVTPVVARFGDIDNDGWLDLLIVARDGGVHLLRNDREGGFDELPGMAPAPGATGAAFVDLDHDGDLDLVLVGEGGVTARRNNLDGTFTDVTAALGLTGLGARDVDFGDVDGDARVDLLLTGGNGGPKLLLNEGARRFRDASAASALSGVGAAAAGAIADLDNDGALDVVVADRTGAVRLARGGGDGTFAPPRVIGGGASAAPPGGGGTVVLAPVDYDNDGRLDVVTGSAGLRLLRNLGEGEWAEPEGVLPPVEGGVSALRALDLDDDGDLDLLVGRVSGGALLLRNDGGNLNRAMRVQLNALGTGSGKNNDFGIGARLELRVGDLLQTRVVTEPVTHLGLGPRLKADVLRVEWPNGVPQTLYFPGTDQDVLEIENLKGSCAFLYTWDGERFRFVTDVTWRSALGMPIGLMGSGSALYAPAAASQEYLRIPGEALRPREGRYVLQLTEELWETAYMDQVRLLSVDHPDSVEVFVDERFVPPGPVELRIYPIAGARPPSSAVDGEGRDLLPALREKDDVYVSELEPLRYQGLVESHDLILDLGEEAGAAGALLLLRGWIYPTDASINVALSQQDELKPTAPSLEVIDPSGRWVTAIPSLSFPSGKDKTIVIELDSLFQSADRRVRIRTNLQIYWDQAVVAREAREVPLRVTTLEPVTADLHFRGFSRMYRKGGRSGPHWFRYDEVAEESPWRPIRGTATRFGDVLPLLDAADDRYVVMAPGDETTVEFDAEAGGALPQGWRRDFLLYTNGWIKDADLNTAFGDSVEPLPFHGIRQYPYAEGETYPDDAEHRRYLREYHTRVLDGR